MADHDITSAGTTNGDDIARERRRKILKIGAYAAYTAPLLLAMATSAKAQTTSLPKME